MFGADTSLVMDALQIGALASAIGGGAVWYALRRRKRDRGARSDSGSDAALEDRVRVLERIATDRSADLADEIESLREKGNA